MKSYAEIRAEAWQKMRAGHWVLKFATVWCVLMLVLGLMQSCWDQAVKALEIQTWNTFLQAKAKALLSGLDLTVPSRTALIKMSEATTFEMFLSCLIGGLATYAMFAFFLKAAKGERERWFAAPFAGFKRPFDVLWLYFRYVLHVSLWTLLFVVPGIVAAYRYSQCWNLKVEHPDWSAGQCLTESGHLMKGRKWRRFSLDCSYWKPITLVLLGLLALTILVTLPEYGISFAGASLIALALCVGCCWGALVLTAYLSIGQALFYLDIKETTAHDGNGDTATGGDDQRYNT